MTALAAIALAAASPFLAPRAEPTLGAFSPPLTNWPALTMPLTGYVQATNCSEYTLMAWLKSRDYPLLAGGNLGVEARFSAQASRSTEEGGPELPACYESGQSNWYPLGGEWFSLQVTGSEEPPPGVRPADVYPHGVYAVQIDNPLGWEVELWDYAGGSRLRPLGSGTNIVFNVEPTGGWWYEVATIRARLSGGGMYDYPLPTVRAAVAPVVQFHGSGLWNYDPFGGGAYTDRNEHFLGINPDEYQLVAFRARVIDTGRVAHRVDALAWDLDYIGTPRDQGPRGDMQPPYPGEVTNALDTPLSAPYFERGASARIQLGSLYGAYLILTNSVYCYGAKMWDRWLTDGQLRQVRDRDVEVMRERGVEFGVYSNNWTLTYQSAVSSAAATGATQELTEDVSGARYYRTAISADNTYSVLVGVDNVPAADPATYVTPDMLTLYSPDATRVATNEVTFSGSGIYQVTASLSNGVTKTTPVAVQGGAVSRRRLEYWEAGYPSKNFTSRVLDALRRTPRPTETNTYAGLPTLEWRIRRLPCLPTATSRGSDTRGCVYMGALSPRTYFTAWHWRWWYSGTETFTDPQGGTHRVNTDYNSVVRLVDWAAAQGIPTNGIAEWCGDIAVGAFSSGSLPAECTPYLMDTNTAGRVFGTAPVLGWCGTQTAVGWANPLLVSPRFGRGWLRVWLTPRQLQSARTWGLYPPDGADDLTGLIDADTQSALTTISNNEDMMLAPVYAGDSGIGVYLDAGDGHGGAILVSHFTAASSGPSYVAAYPLLKAWIEAHGDQVKEWEGD